MSARVTHVTARSESIAHRPTRFRSPTYHCDTGGGRHHSAALLGPPARPQAAASAIPGSDRQCWDRLTRVRYRRTNYSDAILNWWRTNGGSMPAWAIAASIVFCISSNPASCERIFAIVKNLFGDEQLVRRSRMTSVRHSCSITMTVSIG